MVFLLLEAFTNYCSYIGWYCIAGLSVIIIILSWEIIALCKNPNIVHYICISGDELQMH